MWGRIHVRIKQLSSSESPREETFLQPREGIWKWRHLWVAYWEYLLLGNWVAAPVTMSTDQKFSFKPRASEAEQRCFIPTTSSACCSWQKVKRAGKEMIGPFKFLFTYRLHQGQGVSVYLLLNDLSRCASVRSPWRIAKESLQVTAETETERIYSQWKGQLLSWIMS